MSEPFVIKGGLAGDERGVVRFVNGFNFEGVKRFYTIENHQVGYVRAWHGHWRESKWIYVASGAAMIAVAHMTLPNTREKFVLSAEAPGVLYVPPGYANGSMSLVPGTVIIHFSDKTLEESKGDDVRIHWLEYDDKHWWRINPR